MKRLRLLESALAGAGAVWLVGSGNWPTAPAAADRDYVTAIAPSTLAQDLAGRFGGRAFVMDESRQYWRLVAPQLPMVDLAPVAGGDIGHDLSLRDFTMNAVAAYLPAHRPLLDPFLGLTDLRHGLVRQVSAQSLPADPLRVLRGLRLASEHAFVIESCTWSAMRTAAPGLQDVKPERIRMELLRALQGAGWIRAALACSDLDLWTHLPLVPVLAVDRQALECRLGNLARSAPAARSAAERIGGMRGLDHSRAGGLAVLAAVCLAGARDADGARRMGEQLRFSAREIAALAGMVAGAADMGTDVIGRRRAYALVERYGAAAAWSAALAANSSFLDSVANLRLPDLSLIPDGRALAAAVGRPPGPWLGPVVDHLRRLVALGELDPERGPQEAVAWTEKARQRGAPSQRRE